MKKGTKGRPRKRDHWTLPEWKTFSPWMTEHERRGTPWAMREKLWEEKHNKYRSCQALRAAWNRWKLGWRPKILENSEEICSSISRAPADAAPEEQHKPFNTQADSSALPIGSATPTQDETPQMSRFQRRNKRRMLTRRLTYRLFRTLKFCVNATTIERECSLSPLNARLRYHTESELTQDSHITGPFFL